MVATDDRVAEANTRQAKAVVVVADTIQNETKTAIREIQAFQSENAQLGQSWPVVAIVATLGLVLGVLAGGIFL